MTTVIVVEAPGDRSSGDYMFALKYAHSLRQQIYAEQGVLDDVLIVCDSQGIDRVRRLGGDKEYHTGVISHQLLHRLVRQGVSVDLVIEAPVETIKMLDKVDKALSIDAPAIPLHHISEYQHTVGAPTRERDFQQLSLTQAFAAGFPIPQLSSTQTFKGIIAERQLMLDESDSRGRQQFYQQLKATMPALAACSESYQELSKTHEIAVQYAAEMDTGGHYPCEKFLQTYFAAEPLAQSQQKSQELFLIGDRQAKVKSIKATQDYILSKGYKKIIIVDESGHEEVFANVGEGPVVRCHLHRSLAHQQMIALLACSQRKISGCTGDHSLSEVLSASHLPSYECRNHKTDMRAALNLNVIRRIEQSDVDEELKSRARAVLRVMDKPYYQAEDIALLESAFAMDGVRAFLATVHGQVANEMDLVDYGYRAYKEENLLQTSADTPYSTMVMALVNSDEAKALLNLNSLEADVCAKTVGGQTLFALADMSGMPTYRKALIEKFKSNPKAVETLLWNSIKTVDMRCLRQGELDLCRQISMSKAVDQISHYDLSAFHFPDELRSELPQGLAMQMVKKTLSIQLMMEVELAFKEKVKGLRYFSSPLIDLLDQKISSLDVTKVLATQVFRTEASDLGELLLPDELHKLRGKMTVILNDEMGRYIDNRLDDLRKQDIQLKDVDVDSPNYCQLFNLPSELAPYIEPICCKRADEIKQVISGCVGDNLDKDMATYQALIDELEGYLTENDIELSFFEQMRVTSFINLTEQVADTLIDNEEIPDDYYAIRRLVQSGALQLSDIQSTQEKAQAVIMAQVKDHIADTGISKHDCQLLISGEINEETCNEVGLSGYAVSLSGINVDRLQQLVNDSFNAATHSPR